MELPDLKQVTEDGIQWTIDGELKFTTFRVMQDPDTWTFHGTSSKGARFAALSADPEKFDSLEIVDMNDPQRKQIGVCAVWHTGNGVWGGLDHVRSTIAQNL